MLLTRILDFPLIAEQRRIIANVDELMAVLDALEATIAKLHAA